MRIEDIARVCHEANRGYCMTLGDFSQAPWDITPSKLQESAINGVAFRLLHPEATPQDQHDVWSRQKLAEGWKYGPVKDVAKKEHPCLVPYEQLPVEQQFKDKLFGAVVEAFRGAMPAAPGARD